MLGGVGGVTGAILSHPTDSPVFSRWLCSFVSDSVQKVTLTTERCDQVLFEG